MSTTLTQTQKTVERWTADPSRTTVEFAVNHLWGLHTVRGRFNRFDGSYVVGAAGPEIEPTIDAATSTPATLHATSTCGRGTSSTLSCTRRCGSRRRT